MPDFESLPPAFWIVVLGVLGLLIGSFLNVVIYRVPRHESIVMPSSHCGSCGTNIKPYDNVPVLSYLLLRGRCRACRAPISPRYPAVEAITAILFLAAYWSRGAFDLGLFFDCVFVALIVPLVFIDADIQILPARITHPGLVFALVARGFAPNLLGMSPERYGAGYLLGLADGPDWYVSLVGAAAGGLLGGGGLFVLGIVYELVRKDEGMGLGDVAMMCFVGAYLGWELTLLTVLTASLVGSVVGLGMVVLRGKDFKLRLPFGVFLGAGAVLSLLYGARILVWYTSLYADR